MRITLALLVCVLASSASAQKPGKAPPTRYFGDGPCSQPFNTTLCVPLDNTFSVVRMDGTGGFGQADPGDPCQLNDDDFSGSIPLQFNFNMFGTVYTDVYINNNGNVSFGNGFATYTPSGFPVSGFPMVAPFWGDVDTRGTTPPGGTVWMRSEPTRLIVTWDHVGYYNQTNTSLNTFQLILTDGNDPLIGIGNNVCFCYDDMQWTTGSASGGTGGFGGSPATVGVNSGDGVNFFQIGRFDHAGNDYDGPGGNNDGVDWLDNQQICFSVDSNIRNAPPIAVGLPPGNRYIAIVGQPLVIPVDWIPPELGQNIASITVNDFGLANITCAPPTLGPNGNVTCTFTPTAAQLGPVEYFIDITATDDFNTPASTTVRLFLKVCPRAFCTPFGTGCGGPLYTPPTLDAAPGSLPILGTTLDIDFVSPDTPNALALITLGLSDQFDPILGPLPADLGPLGLTGCQMLCSCGLDVTFLNLDGNGMGTRSVRVPNDPSLCNLPLCWQGYTLAQGANPLGAITSNGVRCRVGL